MATRTKTAGAVDARAKARERAAAFRERETKLEGFAVDYFTAADRIAAIDVDLEEAIVKLRKRAIDKAASARADVNAAIASMSVLDVPAVEIAERLDLTVSAVRAAIRSASDTSTDHREEPTAPAEPDVDTPSSEQHDEPGHDNGPSGEERAEWAA